MNAFYKGKHAKLAILVAVASYKSSEFTRVTGELVLGVLKNYPETWL